MRAAWASTGNQLPLRDDGVHFGLRDCDVKLNEGVGSLAALIVRGGKM
jgi:hypothetical protein